jgi:hypothetical protein
MKFLIPRNKYPVLWSPLKAAVACMLIVTSSHAVTAQESLVFRSGYEAGIIPNSSVALTDIRGRDSVSGFDWVTDLEGHPDVGSWSVEYTGGTDAQRWARVIAEPGNPGNQVLWYNIIEPNASNGNGRVQSSLYGNGSIREFTMRNRLYLHEDLELLVQTFGGFSFFTLFEFWNNPNWTRDPYPFRIAINLSKTAGIGEPLRALIYAQVDTSGSAGLSQWTDLWREVSTVPIPIAKWVNWDVYLKEGTAETGRMIVKITPEGGQTVTLFDLSVPTQHPDNPNPNGFTHFNPQKVYTSASRVNLLREAGKSVQVYWDDFELEIHASGAVAGEDEALIETSRGRGGDARVMGIGGDREKFNSGGDIFVQVRRRDDWAGGNYVGYLKFDTASVTQDPAEATLELFLNANVSTSAQNLLVYGLNDGFAGGPDEQGEPESGEDWLQGNKKFTVASPDEITGDNAPGFDETTGRLRTDAFSFLGSISLQGKMALEKIVLASPELREFVRQDTNGLLTLALVMDTDNTDVSFVSREGNIAPAPALRLTFAAAEPTWADFPVTPSGGVDTADWLGLLFPADDWVYLLNWKRFIFLPESRVGPDGAWAFVPR